jgi:hypothetical protein
MSNRYFASLARCASFTKLKTSLSEFELAQKTFNPKFTSGGRSRSWAIAPWTSNSDFDFWRVRLDDLTFTTQVSSCVFDHRPVHRS